MRNVFYWFAVVLCICSCSKESGEPVLKLTPSSMETDYSAKRLSFEYTISNPRDDGKVEVSCSASWVTNLKDRSGVIRFEVEDNNGDSSREAKIEVTYEYGTNSISQTFTLTQDYSVLGLVLTPASMETDYSAKSNLSFDYSVSNPRDGVTATISCSESWVTNIKDNDGHVTFDVKANGEETSRTAGINVSYGYGDYSVSESFTVTQEANPLNQPVDLGLSVKWASCNLGASNYWERGGFYQWGGTSEFSGSYAKWEVCPYHSGTDHLSGWEKYNTNSKFGKVDNKTVLESMDDAATVELGAKWRIPTEKEWRELLDECDWTWTTIEVDKGYTAKGYKVQSKVSGYTDKWIFLPAGGVVDENGTKWTQQEGLYWSSSLYLNPNDGRPVSAYRLRISQSIHSMSMEPRRNGLTIRPVTN